MVKKSMRIDGSGPKCPFIFFFSTNGFLPDLSSFLAGECIFSDLFWIILGKFHSIFLILCHGKEKHENRR